MDPIYERRSIRAYKPQLVEKEKLLELAKAAMYAPSATNQRPWRFYFVTNKEKLNKLCNISKATVAASTAPCILCLTYAKDVRIAGMAPLDVALASENLMLKAVELGLGTVFMGIYPFKIREDEVVSILNIPESEQVIGLIGIGYPDEEKEMPSDRYEEDKLHFIV